MLTGPTAVGKTAVAIALAHSLKTEILSADSRQFYRELLIGTDRPSHDSQEGIPHHFVGDRSLSEPLSAGAWAREARIVIDQLLAEGKRPVVVGGSTLYLQALTEGIAEIPHIPPEIRESVNQRLLSEGSGVLFEELKGVDPDFAATLDPTKSQRIARGLEVYEGTGRPLSSYFDSVESGNHQFAVFVLHRRREELYARIDARVDRMMDRGLLDELRSLMQQGWDPGENPLRTIGYRELGSFMRGECSLEKAIELIKRNSRRYAKRQLTWFRRFPAFEWVEIATDTPPQIAAHLAQRLVAPIS